MRRYEDSGASLIEVGLILPLLILLAIGLSEIGFLVVDYMTVTNAARSGARTGSAAADNPLADELILNVVEEAACNIQFGKLQQVTIYRADNLDGSIPTGGGAPVNVYTTDGILSCNNDSHALVPDSIGWPPGPASRDRVLPTLDKLGVEVVFEHDSVTGLFPFPTVSWTERAVMQLEPDTSGRPS